MNNSYIQCILFGYVLVVTFAILHNRSTNDYDLKNYYYDEDDIF